MTQEDFSTSPVAEILDESGPADAQRLSALRADPTTLVVDTLERQREALLACLPRPDDTVLEETSRWVHMPWRRTVVHVLGPRGFRRVRLDRNRNKITLQEQDRAATTTVGVVGLSVGHAVAHTIALEGLAGTLRLADLDELDLGNLNRVPATVLDIGVNKAVVAARRIAEIDPYVRVEILTAAVDSATVAEFLDGLDVVVEECDSFAAKVLVREHARDRRVPVLCETSDGGVLDVERFDDDPGRALFHGLLDGLDIGGVLDPPTLIAAAATLLDARHVTPRMGASVFEVGRTLSTWPQLGGDVALGGATVAAALRRLLRREPLPSGRIRVDLDRRLDDIVDPLATPARPAAPAAPDPAVEARALSDVDAVAHAAGRAPSPYNLQPWTIRRDGDTVEIARAPAAQGTRGDVAGRASAVALGAAARNMAVAAAARGRSSTVVLDGQTARITLPRDRRDPTHDAIDAAAAMIARRSTRAPGDGTPLSVADVDALQSMSTESAAVRVVADRERIDRVAAVLGEDSRIRHLAPDVHTEMVTTARQADDPSPTGVAAQALGLPTAAGALLPLMHRAEVMAHLTDWDAGRGLGMPTTAAVASASALVVVTAAGWSADDLARAGDVAEAVWIALTASGHGACVTQPIAVYARDDAERRAIAPGWEDQLAAVDRDFRSAIGVDDDAVALVLRVVRGTDPGPLSRRRPL
ncbi:Rv1355c family protein [uncultured Williamsia sp.]|uniref:Rv1355c family protein n=1 Tax=uncultured Williamsia sp. TaxID=259311 RepID=UPI0026290F1D|nr:Rv1355c family protein [uncultured Williamsia sp.]